MMGVVRQGSEYSWEANEFHKFRATVTFHIGGTSEIKIREGDHVLYDGFTLRYGPDDVYNTTVRGAVLKKWLVPEGELHKYTPQSAGVVVSPRDTTPETAKAGSTEARDFQVHRDQEGVTIPLDSSGSVEKTAAVQDPTPMPEGGDVVPLQGRQLFPSKGSRVDVSDRVSASRAKKDIEERVSVKSTTSAPVDVESRRAARLAEAGVVDASDDEAMHRALNADGGDIVFADENDVHTGKVRTSVGVDWDMEPHWRTRAKVATERFGASRDILKAICEVEKKGVVEIINKFIAENWS